MAATNTSQPPLGHPRPHRPVEPHLPPRHLLPRHNPPAAAQPRPDQPPHHDVPRHLPAVPPVGPSARSALPRALTARALRGFTQASRAETRAPDTPSASCRVRPARRRRAHVSRAPSRPRSCPDHGIHWFGTTLAVLVFKVRPPAAPAARHHADALRVRQTWLDMWAAVRDRTPLLATHDEKAAWLHAVLATTQSPPK